MLNSSDDVFIDGTATEIQEMLLHLHEDPSWWPGLHARGGYAWLELDAPTGPTAQRARFKVKIEESRPGEGFRWRFESGDLKGTAEFWFEGFRNGTIVHYLTSVEGEPKEMLHKIKRHRWAIRNGLNCLKDRLEVSTQSRQV